MSAPVTATQLVNAGTDTDHIAEIATSTGLTATDRLGNAKQTLQGALLSIGWISCCIYSRAQYDRRGTRLSVTAASYMRQRLRICHLPHLGLSKLRNFIQYRGMLRTELSNLDGSSRIGHTNSATDAIEETVETV